MEMILTGDQVDAHEALRIGLVNAVVPHADLLKTAETMAQKIIGKGQVAVRLGLKAVNALDELPLSAGVKAEAEYFGQCCSSEDFKEGTTAFLEKRKAVFKGR
jgi:enoyl-CoA hydratase/carnithine racemase